MAEPDRNTLVIYDAVQSDFAVTGNADGSVTVEGPYQNGQTVKNTLINVEQIRFTDSILSVSGGDLDNTSGYRNDAPVAENDEFTTQMNSQARRSEPSEAAGKPVQIRQITENLAVSSTS